MSGYINYLDDWDFLYTENDKNIKLIEDICIYLIMCTIGIQFIINIVLFFRDVRELWNEIIKARSLNFVKQADQTVSRDRFN